MYFDCSPHGYCVEEAFISFVPEYLEKAALITDKMERKKYLESNVSNQFEAFAYFVRNDICMLLKSLEGFYDDNASFVQWVHVVAKKHEYRLLKNYMAALNAATDRKLIKEQLLKR